MTLFVGVCRCKLALLRKGVIVIAFERNRMKTVIFQSERLLRPMINPAVVHSWKVLGKYNRHCFTASICVITIRIHKAKGGLLVMPWWKQYPLVTDTTAAFWRLSRSLCCISTVHTLHLCYLELWLMSAISWLLLKCRRHVIHRINVHRDKLSISFSTLSTSIKENVSMSTKPDPALSSFRRQISFM